MNTCRDTLGGLRRAGFGLLLIASLAGCALVPPALDAKSLFDDSLFQHPARPAEADNAMALDASMRAYLHSALLNRQLPQGKARALFDALYGVPAPTAESRLSLRLDYAAGGTRNAAQAFAARSGNCLSLVVMTAAFAKALDLPIEYQALVGQESWSRDGNLSLINGHVNITVAKRMIDRVQGLDPDGWVRLDFGALPLGRGAALRRVSEATIMSMFMNNRAAEALVRGDRAQAYAYAREAVLQDPGYAGAFNTLAVIYRLQGLADAAERTLRHALVLDGEHRAALDNLARLLEAQDRAGEAAPLRQALRRIETEPPFQQFDLGRAALARGDYAAARDHLLREMRRDPDYHEFHFWLAIALAGLGDKRGASEQLTLALDNSTTKRDHALYAGKLERLKALATRSN